MQSLYGFQLTPPEALGLCRDSLLELEDSRRQFLYISINKSDAGCLRMQFEFSNLTFFRWGFFWIGLTAEVFQQATFSTYGVGGIWKAYHSILIASQNLCIPYLTPSTYFPQPQDKQLILFHFLIFSKLQPDFSQFSGQEHSKLSLTFLFIALSHF